MKTTYKSTVELIDHMGTDLTVVNAAKVSFDKESEWDVSGYEEHVCLESRSIEYYPNYVLKKKDAKLIKYLADNNHWSPFAHTAITLRVTAPIFVARQLVKHQVGGVWNEVSRRYVNYEPEFYFPIGWRGKPINAKQGSDGIVVDQGSQTEISMMATQYALDAYNTLLGNGVAPEQARMVLPQNAMTSWYWTGSLVFFHRVWKQRTDAHAQVESAEVGHAIGEICEKLFPHSWPALCNTSSNS